MPSSTFSFDTAMSDEKHIKAILLGMLIGLLLILAVENLVRLKGGRPDVRDTPELWASQRARASAIGADALILVGSSRIQLDLDLDILARNTGLEPVQLAIDGSPYLEVLENLAEDDTVTGTVLISTTLRKLFPSINAMRVNNWIAVYEGKYRNLWFPEKEQLIKAGLQSMSALYANILPLDELLPLLLDDSKTTGDVYLKTFPSRERTADFSLVKMPDFYLRRVQRELGQRLPAEAYASHDSFRDAVIRMTKENYSIFNADTKKLQRVRTAMDKLKSRGVDVILVRFPVSGLVESISDIRYPQLLWDKVVSDLGVRLIDYKDYPKLAYQLPDGSHLDKTQKSQFTLDFANILMKDDYQLNHER